MSSLGLLAASDPWVRWDWVNDHRSQIFGDLREHVLLTVIAVAVGFVISFPLALLARRYRRTEGPIVAVTGIMYTIPSLALFALLLPWTGLTRTTAEIGLISYTLLILIRNIVAGLDAVPDDAVEAAKGMGFTPTRTLLRVELPLAVPTIIAGLRVATVTTIGLVTVTAIIAQRSLGSMILDGLQRDFRTPLVVGAVLSVVLAVIADLTFVGLQWLLTPWTRARRRS